jgi:hypothetical protein
MKKRLLLAAMLSICIIFIVSINAVNAATYYYPCVVSGTGTISGGATIVWLTGGGIPQDTPWYQLGRTTTESNQGLAIVLTAITMGANVGVSVTTVPGGYPIIEYVLMVP